MADVYEQVARSMAEHWPLMASIAAGGWFAGKWLLKKGIPDAIKLALMNGSGQVVRDIVRTENVAQTALHAEEWRRALREHEQMEAQRFQAIETRLEDLDARQRRVRRPKR